MEGTTSSSSSSTHGSINSTSSGGSSSTTYAHSAPPSRVGSYAALAALSLARPSAHVFPVVINSHSRSSILASSSRSSARWREATAGSETEAGATTSEGGDSSTDGTEDWSEGEDSPSFATSSGLLAGRDDRGRDDTTPRAVDERREGGGGGGGGSRTPMPHHSSSSSTSQTAASSYFAQDAAIALARAAATMQHSHVERDDTTSAAAPAHARRKTPRTRSRTAGSSPLLPATSLVPLTTTSSSSAFASSASSSQSDLPSTAVAGPSSAPARRARSRSWVSATGLAFTPTPRTASPSPSPTAQLTPQPPLLQLGERALTRSGSAGGTRRRSRAGSSSSAHSNGAVTAPPGGGGQRRRRAFDGAGSETEAEADSLGLGIGRISPALSSATAPASRRGSGLYLHSSAEVTPGGGGYFALPNRASITAQAEAALNASRSPPSAEDLPPPYSPSRPASPPRFEGASVDAATLLHDVEGVEEGLRRRRMRDASTSCTTPGGASSMQSGTSHSPSLPSSPPPRTHRALPPPLAQTFVAPPAPSPTEAGLLYLDMSASSAWVMRWLLHPLRLLAAVPGCIGTFWLLRHAMLCALEEGAAKRGMPSAAQYAVASLWSISTAYHALSFTTLLLRRWLAYYALPSSLIRLVALQAICWPLVRLTVFLVGVRSPLAAWVIIGTTTAFSDTVARWVTSNIADRNDDDSEAEGERREVNEAARRKGARGARRENNGGRWFWRAIMGAAPRRARVATGYEDAALPPHDAQRYARQHQHPRTTALSVTSGPESEWDSDLDAGLLSGGARSNSEADFDPRSDAELELDLSSPEENGRIDVDYLRRDAYDDRLAASRRSAAFASASAQAGTRQWNARAAAQRRAARSIRDKHPARVFHWGVALRRNVLPIALLGYTSMWVLLIDAMRSS